MRLQAESIGASPLLFTCLGGSSQLGQPIVTVLPVLSVTDVIRVLQASSQSLLLSDSKSNSILLLVSPSWLTSTSSRLSHSCTCDK